MHRPRVVGALHPALKRRLSAIQSGTYGMCVKRRSCWTQNALPTGRRRVRCAPLQGWYRAWMLSSQTSTPNNPGVIPLPTILNLIAGSHSTPPTQPPSIFPFFLFASVLFWRSPPRLRCAWIVIVFSLAVAPRVALALRNSLQRARGGSSAQSIQGEDGRGATRKKKEELDAEVG